MKLCLTFFFLLLSNFSFANMASPLIEGTRSSAAISSKDIDILREKIVVIIGEDFKTALFEVEYTIKTNLEGKQIPLLFHAEDFKEKFTLLIDGKPGELLPMPGFYTTDKDSPFKGFSESFRSPFREGESETITIYWSENWGHGYRLNDLHYFEADLSPGIHKIRISYVADVWYDRSGWVNEYSFRYSLSPAKHWKSFGGLEIEVRNPGFEKKLHSNLGAPAEGNLDSVAAWRFESIPQNVFQISYTPKIGGMASILIKIGPFWMAVAASLLLLILNVLLIKWYRTKLQSKYSPAVIIGSILVPFLFCLVYIFSFELIDSLIGEEAGRYHGYTFLIVFLYPFILPFYWIAMWLLDRRFKRKVVKES